MFRIAYVNGRYAPFSQAMVHVEDRGYQLADGVYEVFGIIDGRLLDLDAHMERLTRSLHELEISWPMAPRALVVVVNQVVRRNRLSHGIVYVQITRGEAPRDHAFPDDGTEPSVVVTARRRPPFDLEAAKSGVAVITVPDERWKRCDIKSISLIPNVLGKQKAKKAGVYEAWMVDEKGFVTEGTSTNAWVVTDDGILVTRHLDKGILPGITRRSVLMVAEKQGIELDERPFALRDLDTVREAFLTSTTSWIKPVVEIDGRPVGDGTAGPFSLELLKLYAAYMAGAGTAR